ncbi:LAFE_0E05996g1_1 [Lachancea fermentati]|uniref:Protein EFR3 n=1 Tax=Lachancea fermentati TaxID=4955 RepID=A0A1G4MD67_LACFM|nr:LAFE_0E05996g1_1 [Lachancea fermentati]
MRILFAPKHQKLVNQCYPPGRTPDKKPKSSETSYLLYYVNSRRTKLEKVSTYLTKKCTNDLNHRRIGNVMVTLEIMNKIVNHCKENLNVFVKDFLQIMTRTLSNNNVNNDTGIVQRTEEIFGSICKNIDGALCNGDAEFMKMFDVFVNLYLQVVRERIRDDDLLLRGCTDISSVANLASNQQASKLLSMAAELSLQKFQERNPQYIHESLSTTEQPITKRLTRTQTHAVGLDDISNHNDLAVAALQSFFNTSETDKLTLSIRSLLKVLLKTPNKELLQFICNGIPVQLRYIVILIFIRQLNKNKEESVVILKLISSLLVSEVSIVGLSVLDVMRKLLSTQLSVDTSKEISDQCAIAISALNQKTYYKDQTSDMFSEILSRIKDEKDQGNKEMLVQDLYQLILSTTTPSLSLDLFLELAPLTSHHIELFDIVDSKVSGSFSISKLFEFIDSQKSEEKQEVLMATAFAKFKTFTLLAGLKYYLENGSPDKRSYYIYHLNAAKFLDLNDYAVQARHKKENRQLFTRDDLLNFYSDSGSNKYSEKGKRILLSKESNFSTTDLVSTNDERASDRAMNKPSTEPRTLSKFNLSPDVRSLKTLKYNTPKVIDLKKVGSGSHLPSKQNGALRGSQSVKSHITNITFLLSELDSDINEIKIRDPDEDDVVGLEKSDLARSHSIKLSAVDAKGSKRLSIPLELQKNEDDFKDANEEIEVPSTRGKLFTT